MKWGKQTTPTFRETFSKDSQVLIPVAPKKVG
jgi:hypothetical protein